MAVQQKILAVCKRGRWGGTMVFTFFMGMYFGGISSLRLLSYIIIWHQVYDLLNKKKKLQILEDAKQLVQVSSSWPGYIHYMRGALHISLGSGTKGGTRAWCWWCAATHPDRQSMQVSVVFTVSFRLGWCHSVLMLVIVIQDFRHHISKPDFLSLTCCLSDSTQKKVHWPEMHQLHTNLDALLFFFLFLFFFFLTSQVW